MVQTGDAPELLPLLELDPAPLELDPAPLELDPAPLELDPAPLELETPLLDVDPPPFDAPLELDCPPELAPDPLELELLPVDPPPGPELEPLLGGAVASSPPEDPDDPPDGFTEPPGVDVPHADTTVLAPKARNMAQDKTA